MVSEQYTTIIKPLNEATNKTLAGSTKQVNWTAELYIAFNTLK
jgi:hypothetical protein